MRGFKRSAEELISNFRTLNVEKPRNNTHGLANFFCKQLASKYFRLLQTTQSLLKLTNSASLRVATDNTAVSVAVYQ